MVRHWQGTGKLKMRKSRQVMLHFADVTAPNGSSAGTPSCQGAGKKKLTASHPHPLQITLWPTTIGPSISRRRRLVLRTTTARNVFLSCNGTSETCPPLTKSSLPCLLLAKIVASGTDSLQLPSRFSHQLLASPPIPPPTSLLMSLRPSPQLQHHLPPPPPPHSHSHSHSIHLRIQAQHHLRFLIKRLPLLLHLPTSSCAPVPSQR